jgi:hypothetical protein
VLVGRHGAGGLRAETAQDGVRMNVLALQRGAAAAHLHMGHCARQGRLVVFL